MSVRRPKLEDFSYFDNGIHFSEDINDEHMVPGCRVKDCIPSIDSPVWLNHADSKKQCDNEEPVLILINPNDLEEVYAVPKYVLDHHEVVNFKFKDGTPVAITYCPLCDTSACYLRLLDGKELELGVSGLLYNSAVIVFDRHTDSLFSQVLSKGIHGEYIGKKLTQLPMIEISFIQFIDNFPTGVCISHETGFPKRINKYTGEGYKEYREKKELSKYFPIRNFKAELPVKSSVYHLVTQGQQFIISKERLSQLLSNKNDFQTIQLNNDFFVMNYYGGALFFAGSTDIVKFDEKKSTEPANLKDLLANNWIPSLISYYFAARAYFPNSVLIH